MAATLVKPFDYQKAVVSVLRNSDLNQSELAEVIGVTQGRVSQIANGIDSQNVKYETRHGLYELCVKYGIGVEFLT